MIPLRDVIPSRSFPFINIGLIVINSIVFLFELSIPDADFPRFLRVFAIVPGDLLWPTVLTSMFIHGGWLHSWATCCTSGFSATTSKTASGTFAISCSTFFAERRPDSPTST